MFTDKYKNELDNLKLSEDFKEQTVLLMMEKAENAPVQSKTVYFPKKAVKNIAAACFILAVSLYGSTYFYDKFDFASTEQAAETDALANDFPLAEKETDSDRADTENVHGVMAQTPVYTIANRRRIDSSTYAADNMKKEKIAVNVDNSGGMGFEAYMLKSPAELEQNYAYTIGDKFTTLPVYRANTPDSESLTAMLKAELDKFEIEYGPFTYKWAAPVYHETGEIMYNETFDTTSPLPTSDKHFLSEIRAEFSDKDGVGGNMVMHVGRGWYRIEFDKLFTDKDTDEDIIHAVSARHPELLKGNYVAKRTFDYDIYGEIYDRTYLYEAADDYGVNIFNSTLCLTGVAQFDNRPGISTIVDRYIPACWEVTDNLPAIDYTEALDLLYKGVYYSSAPYEITRDTKVSHIELTYLNSYYELRVERYTGYTLPFYKFYVDITDDQRADRYEETGLRTYAAYYVCAIHPDFIEIGPDSGYAGFNQ